MQPFAGRAAMHRHAVNRRQRDRALVQRQVALLYQPRPHPILKGAKLAFASPTPHADAQAPALALQGHHVVHKARPNPEVTRSLTMAETRFDKSNDPTADLNRMCFDHSQPLHLAGSGSHKPANTGILNRCKRDMLLTQAPAAQCRRTHQANRLAKDRLTPRPVRPAEMRTVQPKRGVNFRPWSSRSSREL